MIVISVHLVPVVLCALCSSSQVMHRGQEWFFVIDIHHPIASCSKHYPFIKHFLRENGTNTSTCTYGEEKGKEVDEQVFLYVTILF